MLAAGEVLCVVVAPARVVVLVPPAVPPQPAGAVMRDNEARARVSPAATEATRDAIEGPVARLADDARVGPRFR